jgi:hypothetical protein
LEYRSSDINAAFIASLSRAGARRRSTLGEDPFHPKRNRTGIGAIW